MDTAMDTVTLKDTAMENKSVLITGGAGFIGSNLVGYFLERDFRVRVLDNFSTGYRHNLTEFEGHPRFKLIEGDIRCIKDCYRAIKDAPYVLHQAALGSVPRSIKQPELTNEVNIGGFLNMLIASRDCKVRRFVYAASSSTYGDSKELPKVEHKIGRPLSPYAITKYVNELYADVFARIYGLECIGLRYFNVFGPKQDPNGAYAAVIPLFVRQLLNRNSPVINGSGNSSRDFTYIDNVLKMNELAITTANREAINTVYNTACGERTSLNALFQYVRELLAEYDPAIHLIKATHGPLRAGDIPHSLASIRKAGTLLGYKPSDMIRDGLRKTMAWYWKNFIAEQASQLKKTEQNGK